MAETEAQRQARLQATYGGGRSGEAKLIGQNETQSASDAVVKGNTQFQQLGDVEKQELRNYWINNPQDAFKGINQGQGLNSEQAARLNGYVQPKQTPGWVQAVGAPLEWVGAKLYQAYSSTVSPILSAGILSARSVLHGGRPDGIGTDGNGYWSQEWDSLGDYWQAGHHISPGQALWLIGRKDSSLEKQGIGIGQFANENEKKELFYARTNVPKTAADKAKDAYFAGGTQKYVSGALDVGVSWYADPLVLAGKAGGAFKAEKLTRPLVNTNNQAQRLKAFAQADKTAGLKQAWQNSKFGERIAPEKYGQTIVDDMVEHVNNVKARYSDPDAATAALRDSMKTVSLSSDGNRFAKALVAAKSDNEIRLALKSSFGDAAARDELKQTNVLAAANVSIYEKQTLALNREWTSMTQAEQLGPAGRANRVDVDNLQEQIQLLSQQSSRIKDMLAIQNTVSALNFNKVTSPFAFNAREVLKGNAVSAGLLSSATPLAAKLYQGYNNIRPSGYIDIHDAQAYRELDASLRDARALSPEERQALVGKFISSDDAAKSAVLHEAESKVLGRLADKYGVSAPEARQIYEDYVSRRSTVQANMQKYSAARIEDPSNPLDQINVAFVDSGGAAGVVHPVLTSQIANSHMMMNFDVMDKVLKANAAGIRRLTLQGTAIGEGLKQFANIADSYWKFATLARLGYPIRALSDDFLGQTARFGATAAITRGIKGVERGKLLRGYIHRSERASDEVAIDAYNVHIDKMKKDVESIDNAIAWHKNRTIDPTTGKKARANSVAKIQQLEQDKVNISSKLDDARNDQARLRDKYAVTVHEQVFTKGGAFPGPLDGIEGELFGSKLSGKTNYDNILGHQADYFKWRNGNSGWAEIDAGDTLASEAKHMSAWLRDINAQIGNDELAKRILRGDSDQLLAKFIKDSKRKEALGLTTMSTDDMIGRLKAHVNHYLPPDRPGVDVLRAKVARGEPLTGDELKAVFPKPASRPNVNSELLSYARGENRVAKAIDSASRAWFKIASELPAQKLLRQPLFAQLYRGSVHEQVQSYLSQGLTHIDEELRQQIVTTARQQALRDVKKFTFNMDHETKLAHNMRFFGAFFGAQQESWNRWARIFSDKPETIGKANLFYSSTLRNGTAVDIDGDPIVGGYAIKTRLNEKTGKPETYRVLAKRSSIMIQVPGYLGGGALKSFFGSDSGSNFRIPLQSINFTAPEDAQSLVTGPYVQVGLNAFSSKSPKGQDFLQKLGLLKYGHSKNWYDPLTPAYFDAWLAEHDEGGDKYQQWMLTAMQIEDYKYHDGQREKPATWKEIQSRADRMASLNFWSSESGFSFKESNPYQFYIQELKKMTDTYGDIDGKSKFYEKYGDAAYSFASSLSQNNSGIQATQKGFQVFGDNKALIDKLRDPKLASVVVGDEGNGQYSQGAYYLEQHTNDQTGSLDPVRGKMSAKEAYDKSQDDRTWQQYNSMIQGTDAELYSRGFTSYSDPGAEDLKLKRDSVLTLFSTPQFSGQDNPYYNQHWWEQFSSINPVKYDGIADDMRKIVEDPAMQKKALNPDGTIGIRSDIVSLAKYLALRDEVKATLNANKAAGGSADILAQGNDNLRLAFSAAVDDLKEKDTKFGYLHTRWFSTDLGYGLTAKERLVQEAGGEVQQ